MACACEQKEIVKTNQAFLHGNTFYYLKKNSRIEKLELYNNTIKFVRIQGRYKASRTAMFSPSKLFQLSSSVYYVRKLLFKVKILID
jgi:hypothetical protein